MRAFGFNVLEFRSKGSLTVQGLEVSGPACQGCQGLGFKICGVGLRVQGFGFWGLRVRMELPKSCSVWVRYIDILHDQCFVYLLFKLDPNILGTAIDSVQGLGSLGFIAGILPLRVYTILVLRPLWQATEQHRNYPFRSFLTYRLWKETGSQKVKVFGRLGIPG